MVPTRCDVAYVGVLAPWGALETLPEATVPTWRPLVFLLLRLGPTLLHACSHMLEVGRGCGCLWFHTV